MGSKGNKRYLKRLATPGHLQIARKERSAGNFFMKSRPGSHSKQFCLPLGHILRDILKFSQNSHESKFILSNRNLLVDGQIRKDLRFPVGLMDVIEIPSIKKAYRVLPSSHHGMILSEISSEMAKFKLCRVENITTIKGGKFQLNLHDGRNIIVSEEEAHKYKTRGTLKISLPEQEILDYFSLEEGNQAIIKSGTNIGVSGKISKLVKRFGVNASLAELQTPNGEISTSYDYVFPIGHSETAIDLPMDQ
ncbi:MAG: 30S ribosomal protein S4e [Promethearchaeota archaeon]